MNARAAAPLALALLVAVVPAWASAAHTDEPEEAVAAPPAGGTRFADPEERSTLPWMVGGALALVLGVVVASSASKRGRHRADPLVTLPSDADSRAFARGRDLAYVSPPPTLDAAFRTFEARGLGSVHLVSTRPGERVLDVTRCAECRRSRGAGCEAARGYLAAVFEFLANREVDVVEVECDPRTRRCRFRVTVTGSIRG